MTLPSYRHTQVGYLIIYVLGAMAILDLGILAVLGAALGVTGLLALPLLLFIIFVVCVALFASLTVSVDPEAVRISFGIGLIRFRFPLRDIEAVDPVRNEWWHGWGIHGWPGREWVYNVSGFGAVRLRMRGGRLARIGTDRPEELARAIQQALGA